MEDEVTYRIENQDGNPHCSVIFVLGPDGLLPEKLSKYIQEEMGLTQGEQPVFIEKDGGFIIQKKK